MNTLYILAGLLILAIIAAPAIFILWPDIGHSNMDLLDEDEE